MNELINIIESEVQQTRFGTIQFVLTLHDGQIRCVNVTRTKRHNITPIPAKDIEHERNRKN